MADLTVDEDELVVALNPLEKLGALHGSVRVPLTTVTALDPSDAIWGQLRGWRTPGTGFPGVVALGTWRYRGGKDFVAVYGRTGVVVTLAGPEWNRLLVSHSDPRRLCQAINSHR